MNQRGEETPLIEIYHHQPEDTRCEVKIRYSTGGGGQAENLLLLRDCTLYTDDPVTIDEDENLCYHDIIIISQRHLIEIMARKNNLVLKPNFCNSCNCSYYYNETHKNSTQHKNKERNPSNIVLKHENVEGEVIKVKCNREEAYTHRLQVKNNSESNIRIVSMTAKSTAGFSNVTFSGQRHRRYFYNKAHIEEDLSPGSVWSGHLFLNTENQVSSSAHLINVIYKKNKHRQNHYATLEIILQKRCNFRFDIKTQPKAEKEWQSVSFESNTETPNSPEYVTKMQDPENKWMLSELNKFYNQTGYVKGSRPHNFRVAGLMDRLKETSNEKNVVHRWLALNYLDYLANRKNILEADCTYHSTTDFEGQRLLTLNLQLEKSHTMDLKKADRVMVKDCVTQVQTYGKVRMPTLDTLEIVLEGPDLDLEKGAKMKVTTFFNQQSFNITNHALNTASKEAVQLFFPGDMLHLEYELEEIDLLQSNLTQDQILCVKKIMKFHNLMPFCLVGAPGSGKSLVLVEVAVLHAIQNRKRKKNEKVLMCTPSNSALAVLLQKLLKHIKKTGQQLKVLKITSPSAKVEDICIQHCHLKDGKTVHGFPTVEEIMAADIILTTLQTSIRLRSLIHGETIIDILASVVICDEASFCPESQAMIPVLSQLQGNYRHLRIIYSGDPRQIQFKSKSNAVSELCKDDIITRLLKSEAYQNNPNSKHTMVENHRYPVLIAELLKEISYNDDLECCKCCARGDEDQGLLKIVHVDSEYKTVDSHSMYSYPEAVAALKEAVENKRQNQTSRLIVYYKAQEALIKRMMVQKKYPEIVLSTAESSQGDESDVVVVSPTIPFFSSKWHSCDHRLCMVISRTRKKLILVADLVLASKVVNLSKLVRKALEKGEVVAPTHVKEQVKKNLAQLR